jgi:hypothetical protein
LTAADNSLLNTLLPATDSETPRRICLPDDADKALASAPPLASVTLFVGCGINEKLIV